MLYKLQPGAWRYHTFGLGFPAVQVVSTMYTVCIEKVALDLIKLYAVRLLQVRDATIPLAWFPFLLSSKHHVVCAGKADLDLIKLYDVPASRTGSPRARLSARTTLERVRARNA